MSTSKEPIAKPKKGAAHPKGSRGIKGHFGSVMKHPNQPVSESTRQIFRPGKVPTGVFRSKNAHELLYRITGVDSCERTVMLKALRQGLPYKSITELEKAYCAPRKEIAAVLSIPVSTLTRRKKEGRLRPDESDRVARFARLKDAAVEMMQGDDDAAVKWLHAPLEILGNESPMEHSSTEMGARDVEDLIGRIQYGVFS